MNTVNGQVTDEAARRAHDVYNQRLNSGTGVMPLEAMYAAVAAALPLLAPPAEYPHSIGDAVVIGPETVKSNDGSVIVHMGRNYYPTEVVITSSDAISPPTASLERVAEVLREFAEGEPDGDNGWVLFADNLDDFYGALLSAGVFTEARPEAEVKAEVWEEGWRRGVRDANGSTDPATTDNPYRAGGQS